MTKYDAEAFRNGCFNILPDYFCGKAQNNAMNPKKSEIINRGPDYVLYFPQSEKQFRRSYVVAIDVWNLDLFWQNQIIMTVLVSSIVFFVSFR